MLTPSAEQYTVIECTNPADWDAFVTATGGSFLQSWGWGEAQQRYGRTVHRLAAQSAAGALQAAALLIRTPLPFGRSYYATPHGPLGTDAAALSALGRAVAARAVADRAVFWRCQPLTAAALPAGNWRTMTTHHQPIQTMVLDLTKPLNDLERAFHPKTRYNIHLAEKKGVTIRRGDPDRDFPAFWRLLQTTYIRAGIRLHPEAYYRTLLAVPDTLATTLWLAEHDGTSVAANLTVAFGNTVTYLHGGSDYSARALMAPHLLQWHQIQFASEQGARWYDFWGFDPNRWPGVSRFKAGFNGTILTRPGEVEQPLNSFWYQLYRLAKISRK